MGLGGKVTGVFGELNIADKSFLTNLIAFGVYLLGFFIPWGAVQVKAVGSYALSGAITNWLAIYMLFERVPGLYGSGIIPLKFEEFKRGIYSMIMTEFFNKENLSRFLGNGAGPKVNANAVLAAVDRDVIFEKLMGAIQSSSFGPMLVMIGGIEGIKKMLRQPFDEKINEALHEIVGSPKFSEAMQNVFIANLSGEGLITKVELIVRSRIDELTPQAVKEIIQAMIRSHLGWLVVWGGVFGALIGLVASYM